MSFKEIGQNRLSIYEYKYNNKDYGYAHNYLVPLLIKNIPQGRRLRILDLGCGNGCICHLIAGFGHEVIGIDSSESGIEIAKKNFPGCNFIKANIYELPYEKLEGYFDFVISLEVIEHLLYPRELVRAAKRCLKQNGQLILSTPYHGYLKNLVISILGKWDKHFTVLCDGRHINLFSKNTLTSLLKEEGFTGIKFKFEGRWPYLWKSMAAFAAF